VYRFLILILIVLFVADIASLVFMVDYAGWQFFFCQLFGTATIGIAVIYYVLHKYGSLIRNNIEQNVLSEIGVDKFVLLFAGGLLIMPGISTDIVGLALLLKIVRRFVLISLPKL
jgi:UPF0716 family protein affecting phage T7 exclusion